MVLLSGLSKGCLCNCASSSLSVTSVVGVSIPCLPGAHGFRAPRFVPQMGWHGMGPPGTRIPSKVSDTRRSRDSLGPDETPWDYVKTERVGFEPTEACTSLVFKTRAINHSTTSPYHDQDHVQILARLAPLFSPSFQPLTIVQGRIVSTRQNSNAC